MSMRRTLSIGLVASLVASTVATPTWAGPTTPTPPAAQFALRAAGSPVAGTNLNLRASIDRAAAAALASPRHGRSSGQTRAAVAQQSSGGGGGGGGWIIWTLLGAAMSVGTAYLVMKQMRKQTDLTPAPAR